MRKALLLFSILLIANLFLPSITMAAWWNPLSWFKKPSVDVQQKQTNINGNFSTSSNKAKGNQTSPAPYLKQLINSQIIKKVKPAVVYIETESAVGSGMIISTNGNILTNAHVVEGFDSAKVTLSDGSIYTAVIVGRDENLDIALLKINKDQLSAVDFGNSDKLEQGDEVFAFGFPFGIKGDVSFTGGTVSRKVKSGDSSYIETTAEIHPGNSGGPLVNRYGQVVGINAAIFGKTISGIQIGETIKFAIPINLAVQLLPKLKSGASVTQQSQEKAEPADTQQACLASKNKLNIFNDLYNQLSGNYSEINNTLNNAVPQSGTTGYFNQYYSNFVSISDAVLTKIQNLKNKANQFNYPWADQNDWMNMKSAFMNAALYLNGYYDARLATLQWITTAVYWDDYFRIKAREELDSDHAILQKATNSYSNAKLYYQKIYKVLFDSFMQYCLPPVGSTLNINRSVETTITINSQLSCQSLVESDQKICDLYRNYRQYYNWVIIEGQ